MRSSILFFVFVSVLALTQGAAVESQAVQWSCDVSEIKQLVQELVTDVRSLVNEVFADVMGVIGDTEDCVEAFLSDLDVSGLISCVTNDVTSAITTITGTVEDFLNDGENIALQVVRQVEKCVTL